MYVSKIIAKIVLLHVFDILKSLIKFDMKCPSLGRFIGLQRNGKKPILVFFSKRISPFYCRMSFSSTIKSVNYQYRIHFN